MTSSKSKKTSGKSKKTKKTKSHRTLGAGRKQDTAWVQPKVPGLFVFLVFLLFHVVFLLFLLIIFAFFAFFAFSMVFLLSNVFWLQRCTPIPGHVRLPPSPQSPLTLAFNVFSFFNIFVCFSTSPSQFLEVFQCVQFFPMASLLISLVLHVLPSGQCDIHYFKTTAYIFFIFFSF